MLILEKTRQKYKKNVYKKKNIQAFAATKFKKAE